MSVTREDPAQHTLASLFEATTGQQIGQHRAWRIETSLTPLVRARGLETLDQLIAAVLSSPVVDGEVIDALLNQESSFFRDAAAFDAIADAVEAKSTSAERRMRVWSAGCSTGQEALSLAMLFAERAETRGMTPPEIVATDVSRTAIARARSGRYTQFEIQRGLSVRRMIRWFDSIDGDWCAQPELVRRISFRQMNLVADPLPIGRFDAILCRNVLLYFALPLRKRVFDRLAAALRPDGVLILGAGETVFGQTGAFRPSRHYAGLYEPTGD